MALQRDKRHVFLVIFSILSFMFLFNAIHFNRQADLTKGFINDASPVVTKYQLRQLQRIQRKGVIPKVFFDIAIDGKFEGRIVMKLYADKVPKTAENFRVLAGGENFGDFPVDPRKTYNGTTFHKIIPGEFCQGGDVTGQNGQGSYSIYGQTFADENLEIKHEKAGQLSMANKGEDTNGSQFLITMGEMPQLDGRHVVFGEVIKGMDVVRKMNAFGTYTGDPKATVEIVKSGEL